MASSSAHGVRRVPAVLLLCSLVGLVLAMAVSAGVVPCASNTLSTLEPCLTAVTGRIPLSPTEECCRVIRSTEPTCLCGAVSAYEKYPEVDVPRALLLPKTCGRLIPAGFTCNGQRSLSPTWIFHHMYNNMYLIYICLPIQHVWRNVDSSSSNSQSVEYASLLAHSCNGQCFLSSTRSITCTICLPIMHTYSICLEKCTIIIVRLSIEWICSPSYSLDIISFWCHEVHTLHGFFSAHSKISISWNKCGAYHKLVPAFCERDMLSWGRWMFELCRWMCCHSWIFYDLHLRFMQFAALHYRSVEWSPCPFDIPSHWEIVKTRSDLCSVEWASTITRHCQPDTWYDTKMSNGHWKSVERDTSMSNERPFSGCAWILQLNQSTTNLECLHSCGRF